MPKPKPSKQKTVEEKSSLKEALKNFNDEMLQELMDKVSRGYTGWDDAFNANYMKEQISNHLAKGDWIVVANLAMFLHTLEAEDA